MCDHAVSREESERNMRASSELKNKDLIISG